MIGVDVRGMRVADFPRDCAGAIGELLTQAIGAKAPLGNRMHRVSDGMVATYEMLGFPMSSRWGPPLAGLYVQEDGSRYNLIDTIFKATEEGILALAAVRDAAGTPVELVGSPFHIAGAALPVPQSPPRLGQHTQEILCDVLGLAAEEVERLLREHII